nr:ATP-dependent DNA helicase DDX11 isoform X4 [Leptinotarsa decemlineata]
MIEDNLQLLDSPEEFDFPFPPYDIQQKFMQNLYFALENRKLGIFESPTGTGKSLSIICGAIRWLKDHNKFERECLCRTVANLEIEKQIIASETTDWLASQAKEREITDKLHSLKIRQSKILQYDQKIEKLKKVKKSKDNQRRKYFSKSKPNNEDTENQQDERKVEDDDILPEDPDMNEDGYSTDEDEQDSKYEPVKIFIASRTHSQLSQFVGEIKKSPFCNDIRVISLASRQTYCVNPNVSRLKSMALINERCLDLQKKNPQPKVDQDGKVVKKQKGSSCSCPFYKSTKIEELQEYALVEVQDVEDLVTSAKEMNACPYYASRKAAEDAEVVLIPYNTLLHKATREANGIKLKNNIVIIDEAHNLLEALAQMHNIDLNYNQVYHALHQMKSYKNKFSTRFSAKNLLMINQLIFVVNQLLQLLESLTYSYEDGRILLKKNTDKLQCKLQFLLLNPSSNFCDIVKEARSVIVAGGTMKPIGEFKDRLFINAGASPERIMDFACDHIVPPENILPIIITKGSSNESLLFNFENRMAMGNNIKNTIKQACEKVKGGIVVFFPSYNYENWVWQQVKDINFGRAVFREPQNSKSVDSVLEKYAEVIRKPGSAGALLFSVVGGKLSEGLNFSDELGRCVIVVGLPYANIMAADLKEKMRYLDKTEGAGSGQKYYENQCMKAVNQCIGRAVRHKNDYATVLLLDERYNRASVKNALPNWIKKSLQVGDFNEAFASVDEFFRNKKSDS